MPDDESPRSSIILYSSEDGRTRIECRFEDESIWLTQALTTFVSSVAESRRNE